MPGLRNPVFRLPPYSPKEVRYRRRAVQALFQINSFLRREDENQKSIFSSQCIDDA
jgi:hypothetical protein